MNERNTLLMKIYLIYIFFILIRGPQFVVCSEIDGKTNIQREAFFLYLLPGAKGCQRLHPLQARQRRLRSAACPTLDSDSLPLSDSDRVVLITWSPSGYTPFVPDCPDGLSYPCLLIRAWQLVKAHGVTRNQPKIHVICHITRCLNPVT